MGPDSWTLLLFWPYSQRRPNSWAFTTFLTILPNEAKHFTLNYFYDHTPRWGPDHPNNFCFLWPFFQSIGLTVHPILLFWPYSQTRPDSSPYTTFLTILPNGAKQLNLYYFSDHNPKWGRTVEPVLLFWPYSKTRPNSSPYFSYHTPKSGQTVHTKLLHWPYFQMKPNSSP